MPRNFGTHGGRPNLGGQAMERPHRSAVYAPSNLPPFPHGSILNSSGPAFERFDVSQSLRDIGLVLLGSFTALAVSLAVFIWLFVDTTSY